MQGCQSSPNIVRENICQTSSNKVYNVEVPPELEELSIKPLGYNGVIVGLTQDDIRILKRNIYRLYKWGLVNQTTIQIINKEVEEENNK